MRRTLLILIKTVCIVSCMLGSVIFLAGLAAYVWPSALPPSVRPWLTAVETVAWRQGKLNANFTLAVGSGLLLGGVYQLKQLR